MLFEESYNTIEKMAEGVFRDKGSKFLSWAYPASNEIEVKKIVQQIKSEHPKANHHCYAFRLGPGKSSYRFSDDREPAGSAGKPIFGVIQSKDLTDIVIIVARYFGGTLLGIPGLIHAYRSAAMDAIENSNIVTKEILEKYILKFGYDSLSLVLEMIRISNVAIIRQKLEMECEITIQIPRLAADHFISEIRNHHLLRDKCEITVL